MTSLELKTENSKLRTRKYALADSQADTVLPAVHLAADAAELHLQADLLDLRQQVDYGRAEVRRLEAEVAALRREAAEAAVYLDSILADG